MGDTLYPKATREMAEMRGKLAPEIDAAFRQFSQAVFKEGVLSRKTKQLVAVAVAHVTQCSILHPRPHQGGGPRGREPAGNHGSHLGRGRNAGWWRIRAFRACPGRASCPGRQSQPDARITP